VIRQLVIPEELGASIEVRLLDWIKTEGEVVDSGDALLEFETDKAIVLVTAAHAGTLRRCFFKAGDWLKPGDVAAWLSDQPDDPMPAGGDAVGTTLAVTFDVT
jgi:2-oxoglutarate dehydrogenase E2 component (dihydrolipoamide succinyltransferase)